MSELHDAIYRAMRRKRLARLAQGGTLSEEPVGGVSASPAAYISQHVYVDDCRYVDEDSRDLIKQAKARLMWGQSVTQMPRSDPFSETLVLYENALDRAWDARMNGRDARFQLQKNQEALASSPQRSTWVHKKLSNPQQWTRASKQSAIEVPTRSRRKRLRNRTREERIADLRAALAKEGNDETMAR